MGESASRVEERSAVVAVREAIEERLASGELDLPLLPQVAGRVLTLVEEDSSPAAELSRLIQSDQTRIDTGDSGSPPPLGATARGPRPSRSAWRTPKEDRSP
jgi:hypothetical protein